jgi:hypothetical protein
VLLRGELRSDGEKLGWLATVMVELLPVPRALRRRPAHLMLTVYTWSGTAWLDRQG